LIARTPIAIACVALLGLATLGCCTATSSASVPPGPRLATIELIETRGSERAEPTAPPFVALTTFGPFGEKQRHLLKQPLESHSGVAPFPFYGPAWSGDGGSIAYVGGSGEKARGIYVVGSDGSDPHFVKGTLGGSDPVLSPDGRTLAFARSRTHFPKVNPKKIPPTTGRYYSSTTTWVIDLAGGGVRRLTNWRNGLENTPASFSPDGSTLALTKSDDHLDAPRIVLLPLAGGAAKELPEPGENAAISPDGTKLAFVGYLNPTRIEAEENRDYTIGELYTMNLDGSQPLRLTRNRDKIETSPSWDPSGRRLAYTEIEADTGFDPGLAFLFPTGDAIAEINADGSCHRTVRSSPRVALYGIAWQPGLERAALPLAC
jgi:Tol biopolymer transport system component